MNPIAIHAQQFRCYDRLDLDLPDGCVAILGDNGAGKSSLMMVVDVALFGARRARSLAEFHATGSDDDMVIELEFEHDGERYRIRRSYSPRGRGKATCDFETLTDSGWVPLTCSKISETDHLICETIGLTRSTFYASSFLGQRRGGRDFMEADPSTRKQVLQDVLGLERYDRLQEAAKLERRQLQEQHIELTGRISAAEDLLAGRDATAHELAQVVAAIVDCEDELADLEREHTALSEQYQQAREQAATRTAVEAELREVQAVLAGLQQQNKAADEAARTINAAIAELDQLPAAGDTAELETREAELAAAVAEHARLSQARETALAEHDRLSRRRDELVQQVQQSDQAADTVRTRIADTNAQPDATCDTCGQHLTGDAKKQAVAAYTRELDEHLARSKSLYEETRAIVLPHVPPGLPPAPTVDLDEVRARLRTIREHSARRVQLEERIRQNENTAASGPGPDTLTAAHQAVVDKQAALTALAPVDLDEITRQGTLIRERLDGARATLEQQRTLRARLDERLAQIGEAEKQLVDFNLQTEYLNSQIGREVALERAFGRDGIPALILENAAIPALEVEANRILDELGVTMRVELRTQADLKSGDGVRETLDVVIVTEQGERLYETFSGGEETRIDLALRIALARLLATRRGAESKLLVVDEPDGLDETGMAALVEVLRGLQGDFAKLYVVSHVPALRDSFDTTLTVADGRVVEDGVFETVTA